MNTDLGEKLQSAINNSVNTFIWKDKTGNSIKLVDASDAELQKWFHHAQQMLYNNSIYSPGKFQVRENIKQLWDRINAELFVRYLASACDALRTKKDILDYIHQYRESGAITDLNESIAVLFDNLPPIYNTVSINMLMDACFDKLGNMNKRMIGDKFILSLGIWLTEEEKTEFTELLPDGKLRNRMEMIKEQLCLNPEIRLKIRPSGLSLAEFRSLVQMPSLPKISSLSSVTLTTLRDKVLLLLDNDLNYHIDKWTNISENIKKAAELRGLQLN